MQLEAARVSSGFFHLLSAKPKLGRTFLPSEDVSEKDYVVLLSERIWRRRFSSDPHIVGRSVNLNSKPYTVIGVLPPDFRFDLLGTAVDLWVPALADASLLTPQQVEAGACYLNAVGKLSDGSSLRHVQASLAIREREFLRDYQKLGDANPRQSLEIIPLSEKLVGNYRSICLLLAAAVGAFLAIACANVAGLLLARALNRKREIAIRMALGASRFHVAGQLMAESLLLALGGGIGGLALSLAAKRFSSNLAAGIIPQASVSNSIGAYLRSVLRSWLSPSSCAALPPFSSSGASISVPRSANPAAAPPPEFAKTCPAISSQ